MQPTSDRPLVRLDRIRNAYQRGVRDGDAEHAALALLRLDQWLAAALRPGRPTL